MEYFDGSFIQINFDVKMGRKARIAQERRGRGTLQSALRCNSAVIFASQIERGVQSDESVYIVLNCQ